MRRRTRLHADKATRQLFKERQNLLASQLPSENNLLICVNSVDLKNVLRDIDTDCMNLHGNASFAWIAPKLSPKLGEKLGAGVVHGIKNGNGFSHLH